MWALKKGALVVWGRCWGWNPTQLYRDYFINHEISIIPINQPGFNGKWGRVFLTVAHVSNDINYQPQLVVWDFFYQQYVPGSNLETAYIGDGHLTRIVGIRIGRYINPFCRVDYYRYVSLLDEFFWGHLRLMFTWNTVSFPGREACNNFSIRAVNLFLN